MILFQIDADAFWVTLWFHKMKFGDLGFGEMGLNHIWTRFLGGRLIRESDLYTSIYGRLSIITLNSSIVSYHHCVISNHSAAIYDRLYQTLISTGVRHLGAKVGEKGVDRIFFIPSGTVLCERNRVGILCRLRLSTLHEHHKQTNKPLNGNIDCNRRNRLLAISAN